MLGNDFKLVTSKKKCKNFKKSVCVSQCQEGSVNEQINKETTLRRIGFSKEELLASSFNSSVFVALREALASLGNSTIKEIVCYGLGCFSECVSARYQLALLLLLKDHYQAEVFVYDPVFSKSEHQTLESLGCVHIAENEEGKRKINSTLTTLVYLPHCPRQITNNFLWANWGHRLKNCVLIGNSFSKLISAQPERILKYSANYIIAVNPYVVEFELHNSFKYTDIFNDLSVHIFPLKSVNYMQYPWILKEEPIYSKEDTEFITKHLPGLTLI